MHPIARRRLLPAVFFVVAAVLAAVPVVPRSARAEVAPAKPYADVVAEVVAFLVSDVGNGGIRTNDNDPEGYPVPPYFYHYCNDDWNTLWSGLVGYPGYRSVSYPAYTACVAIDAFLDWRRFSGDPEGLARAREYADWILEHRTPAGDMYGNLPYSTQTDGVMGGGWDGEANMTDKAPMFGLRLLRLYDITGEAAYLDGALEIAATMVATQMSGGPEDDGRWPFRVVPLDGTVTQDYTSHLTPALRFFEDLAERTGDAAYAQARDRVWAWLLANPLNAASPHHGHWEGFYEDQSPEMQTGFYDHYSAHEAIMELIARQPVGWQDMAAAVLDSVDARYLITETNTIFAEYVPITREWMGWPEPTYASSLQYARTALKLYQAMEGDPRQDPAWRQRALDMAAVCSHGQNDRDIAADGRMFTTVKDLVVTFNVDSWYEQNFNTVKYFLELMDLEPSLAPADANHILFADRALTSVEYEGAGRWVRYATAGGAGVERVKLVSRPDAVLAGGVELPELGAVPAGADGWYWDAVAGVATVSHSVGPVEVRRHVSGVDTAPGGAVFRLAAVGAPDAGRVALRMELGAEAAVALAIYDLRGHQVAVLADGRRFAAGAHALSWDGRDAAGRVAASGVYFVRGRAGAAEASARVMLVR